MNHETISRELVFQESTSNHVELRILKEKVRDLEKALRDARAVADTPHTAKRDYEEKLAQAIARHQELQKQLLKSISSWETERSQLQIKIVQLEDSLTDATQRSNNPYARRILI